VIALAKYMTFVLAALLGIYGQLVTLRHPTGRLTIHGWIVLNGVIVLALVGAGFQWYADRIEELSMKSLLTDIDRTLHVLPGLKVSLTLRPDWKEPAFRAYLDKLQPSPAVSGPVYVISSFLSTPFVVDGSLLQECICEQDVALFFFKHPIVTTQFKYDSAHSAGEDLRIETSVPCGGLRAEKNKTQEGMWWDIMEEEGKLHQLDVRIDAQAVDASSDRWKSNGKITSLQDLMGAQLIISFHVSVISPVTFGKFDRLGATAMRSLTSKQGTANYDRAITLGKLMIRLPDGIVLRFNSHNLQSFRDKDGFLYYSFRFPDTMDALIQSTRNDPASDIDDYRDPL